MRPALRKVEISGLVMDCVSTGIKHGHSKKGPPESCNNIGKLTLMFFDDDRPQYFGRTSQILTHGIKLRELYLILGENAATDVEHTDWSSVRLPNLQRLELACVRSFVQSLKQILQESISTLENVVLEQVHLNGGK
jgi:hypothetical protein